jgi:hypothetical protein
VTLKYLSQNPEQVAAFKEYDAIDWDQILKGVNDLTSMTVGEPAVGGGSGGGGVGARPAGYIEITDAGSRYVEVSAAKKTIAVVALGFVAG